MLKKVFSIMTLAVVFMIAFAARPASNQQKAFATVYYTWNVDHFEVSDEDALIPCGGSEFFCALEIEDGSELSPEQIQSILNDIEEHDAGDYDDEQPVPYVFGSKTYNVIVHLKNS